MPRKSASRVEERESQGTAVIERERVHLKEPPMYRVILLNDNYTSMEFVVYVLTNIFSKSVSEATDIMLKVHQEGQGRAGIYTKDIAETKIAMVHALAKQNQFPLKCRLEEE